MTAENTRGVVTLTTTELDALVEKAAERSVRKVLSEIGLFTSDEDNRAETLQDVMWLRRWRKAVDAAAGTIGRTIIVIFLGAIMGAMWIGAQFQISKLPH